MQWSWHSHSLPTPTPPPPPPCIVRPFIQPQPSVQYAQPHAPTPDTHTYTIPSTGTCPDFSEQGVSMQPMPDAAPPPPPRAHAHNTTPAPGSRHHCAPENATLLERASALETGSSPPVQPSATSRGAPGRQPPCAATADMRSVRRPSLGVPSAPQPPAARAGAACGWPRPRSYRSSLQPRITAPRRRRRARAASDPE
jgi:hypothetical protein